MGAIVRVLAKLVAVVGVAALVRPRRDTTANIERRDVTLNPEEQAIATRLPTPQEARQAHEWATQSPPPVGWNKPKPESAPRPTYWPFVLAFGTTFVAWGVISNLFVFFGGVLMFVLAVVGWIGELLHEFA